MAAVSFLHASASGQTAPVIDEGTATARAAVFNVAPSAGSLAFDISAGETIAETAGGLGQAQAQAADLGLIGTALTAEPCDGGEPSFSPETIPGPLKIDNRKGAASADDSELPPLFPGLGAGHKQVSATVTPSSRASVTFLEAEVAPLLELAGGYAVSEAEVFAGEGREARATVTVSLGIADVVDITGLRWHAEHRTGGKDRKEGGFTIDALQVLGVPIPTDDVTAAFEAVNAALAPLGLRIDPPKVEQLTEPIDIVRVTPLRLLVADTPLGAAVRPALDLTREFRSAMFDQLTAALCDTASLLLVGDIGVGILSGSGSLVAEFGGVEATTANVAAGNPFGSAPAGGFGSTGSGPVGGASPIVATRPGGATPGGAVLTSPVGKTTKVCQSVHPFRWPACSHGAAGLVGGVGLVVTGAVAVLDLRRRRTHRLEVAQ